VKQDLELLRVVRDDMLLGLKLGQCHSEPYSKVTFDDQPAYHGGGGEIVHTVHGSTTSLVRVQLLSEKRIK
jgi:hypothetical protein